MPSDLDGAEVEREVGQAAGSSGGRTELRPAPPTLPIPAGNSEESKSAKF